MDQEKEVNEWKGKLKKEVNVISKKKPNYTINSDLREYLGTYGRECPLPVSYDFLTNFSSSFPLCDKNGEDTLWETVLYDQYMMGELSRGLPMTYSLLKTDGDQSVHEHLYVERIDYCTFGNSNPFRIRIVNQFNDNYDYFYIKKADASRIYGLELEHILSPNRISYLVDNNTLIEEHIAGIPGDQFIKHWIDRPVLNRVRISKEFVKFNERCFIRLLGDMRAYNYVVDITPDFDDEQYRVRSIDFDQQSFEGRRTMYLPQYFKDNNAIVQLCMETMRAETIAQYQREERTLMARRLKAARIRTSDLIKVMREDTISTPEKVEQLKQELGKHHNTSAFENCKCMGDIVLTNLKVILEK